MKITLLGYGKMGHLIHEVAEKRHHQVIIAKRNTTEADIAAADVCIDFSHPDAVLEHVRTVAAHKKPMVIGTTGWDEHLDTVEALVKEAGIGVVYGSNFSIGVNLFFKLATAAGELLNRFPQYHAGLYEEHHRSKVDSPSGTAKAIADILTTSCPDIIDAPVAIASLRCGSIPGTHTLVFDSPCDTITMTHTARNRSGFAEGAVTAAEWVVKQSGFHLFSDVL